MVVKNVEKKENNNVSFQVEIDKAEFEAAVQQAYLKNKSSISVPGFRKGKAPRMVIEGMFGSEVFYEDAINELAPKAFELGVEQEALKAVGRPSLVDVQYGEDKSAVIVFETAVYPEVKLGEYKNLEAEKPVVNVDDVDINAELERVRLRNARLELVERPAKMSDEVTLDFKGYVDGVPFEGGEGTDYKLVLGSGQFIPGFEEQVVGMSAGEEKDIDVTFPEDYHKELAGKAAVFHITAKEVRESQVDELDDEFAKDVSEFDTLDEYKESIRQNLTVMRENDSERSFEDALMAAAVANMTVEVPEAMVDEKVDMMIREFSQNLAMQGIRMEQYLQMMGVDAATFANSARPGALQQVKVDLLLKAIVDAENFEVTAEEIEAEYNSISARYGVALDEVKERMPENLVVEDIQTRKAADCIFKTGVAKAPEEKKPAKKTTKKTTKKAEPKAEEAPAEEKAAEEAPAEEKPVKKTTRKTTKKAETEPAAE